MLIGDVISDMNEKASLGVAQKICSDFIAETHAELRKVCVLMPPGHKVPVLKPLITHAVGSLRNPQ